MSNSSPDDAPRTHLVVTSFVCLLAATTALAAWFAWTLRDELFGALACLTGWLTLVTLSTAFAPPPPTPPAGTKPPRPTLQRLLRVSLQTARFLAVAAPLLALIAIEGWLLVRPPIALAAVSAETLRLAGVTLLCAAFLHYFFGALTANVARNDHPRPPDPALLRQAAAARLTALLCAIAGGVTFLFLYTQRDLSHGTAQVFVVIGLILQAETLLHALLRLYQPLSHRDRTPALGRGVILPALFGHAQPLRALGATFEKSFGVKLADAWLLRFVRTLALPLAAVGVLGLWASTAITAVPLEARGVHVRLGAFQPAALPPGLHTHLPWPFAEVVIVPTERVRELSLGFGRDLDGPVLWAEKHFENEQNLLVGGGEELLTINVPIHYRVSDAVAFTQNTADAATALESIGYRQLLTLTSAHTSFGLMTTDRNEVAQALQSALQRECDQLRLGLEIVFVGLKDIHPPVSVAPAFQDVVSAEEEKITLVDHARTYHVESLAEARTRDQQVRVQADATATERTARATGEASRFIAPLAVYESHAGVFTDRLRLESFEQALAGVRNLLLVPGGTHRNAYYLGVDPTILGPAR